MHKIREQNSWISKKDVKCYVDNDEVDCSLLEEEDFIKMHTEMNNDAP